MSGSTSGQVELPLRWLKPSAEPVSVVCATRVYYWDGHWDTVLGRAIRCSGSDCAYCDRAQAVERRWVIGVKRPGGERFLFEMRKRQRAAIDLLTELGEASVGQRLSIRREGDSPTSPVTVSVLSMTATVERWEIEKLVSVLGRA